MYLFIITHLSPSLNKSKKLQCNEVGGSYHIRVGKFETKYGVSNQCIEFHGVSNVLTTDVLITDRHVSIQKRIRESMPIKSSTIMMFGMLQKVIQNSFSNSKT